MAKLTKIQRTFHTAKTRAPKIRTSKKGVNTALINTKVKFYKKGTAYVSSKQDFSGASSLIGSFFVFIFITILLLCVFRIMTGSADTVTFASFLDYISTFNAIDLSSIQLSDTVITADWGIMNGLRDFFNTLASIVNYSVYIVSLFFSAISFVLGIVSFILVG